MNVLAETPPGNRAGRGMAASAARALAFLLAGCGAVTVGRGADLQDYFTNRETITAASGQINANNSTATIEPGEPKHGGKTGGHSMWVSWVAPTNGVAKFQTEGSRFDTLLAAYYFASPNDTNFDRLLVAATADDSEGFERESEIEFGVLAGQRYEIAVDGYFGAAGALELKWSFDSLPTPPPIVLSTPGDQAARLGDPVTLTVVVTNTAGAQFRWFFNGNQLNANTTDLVIPSLQITNVGRYKLRIDSDGLRFFTAPTEIQINSDGSANTLAQGKLLDAPATPLIGTGPPPAPGRLRFNTRDAVVRGYNGSQVFNTTYATVDTNEPPHCGVSGGFSYWLIYQPPTNGTITLDTIGSAYDTVMEAYTFDGALTGYQDLISIQCDDDGAGTNGASRVRFPVVKTRQYVVAVEGVNHASGTAWLNYSLSTNEQPVAPTLSALSTTMVVAQGSPATLAANVTGSPPLRFSWQKDTTLLPGMTAPALFFPSAAVADSANYVVTVTNDLGSLTNTLPLRVVIPTRCSLAQASNSVQLSFPTVIGQRYTVEQAGAVAGPWQPWPGFYEGDGQPVVIPLTGGGPGFFRIRVE
jgi:hypothetical protein